ncbi:nuclear matrix constituent protein 1-like [Macadamia integrifolia]|uniref:nuclear matrix constituent protein 1-like n=1 Tax=Macadamia integrifolia TaxID=60698 RepID=UPI001C4E9D9F|nr:nuclear matrix constituent protein 1-like [Macadamia integrifolia]
MSKKRSNSSPQLIPPSASGFVCHEEHTLEGVATNIKLLLKLVQDHNEVGNREDGRRMQRVAGMMTILDDVKHRIQKSESFGKKREAELRRCSTEIRRTDAEVKYSHIPKDKRPPPPEPITNEEQRLRKELSASLAARKSLERMFSSLGKEKEIMVAELARKVQELNDTEEHLNDLRAQNEKLLAKVKLCAAEHKEGCGGVGEAQINATLQERNKTLSEQLLKSLDGYRSLKRKLRDAQEENTTLHAKMSEITVDVRAGLNKIHEFQHRITEEKEQPAEIEEELLALEHMFQCFEMKVSTDCQKRGECVMPKTEINARNPSVLA